MGEVQLSKKTLKQRASVRNAPHAARRPPELDTLARPSRPSPCQYGRGHARLGVYGLPELPVRIDDDPIILTGRPPADGEILVKFQPLKAWLDNMLHHVLVVPQQVDEPVVLAWRKYLEDHRLAIGPETSTREGIVAVQYLSTLLDSPPYLLSAEPCIDEGESHPGLYQVEKAQVRALVSEIHLKRPKRIVLAVLDFIASQPSLQRRKGHPNKASRLSWRVEADTYQGQIGLHVRAPSRLPEVSRPLCFHLRAILDICLTLPLWQSLSH